MAPSSGKTPIMWKILLAFIAFAALALFILSKGGNVDMGGERHGVEAAPDVPASAVPAPAPSAASQ